MLCGPGSKRPLSRGFRLLGAHCDTPRIDLKQRPLYQDCGVAQLKTHYYGGIRKHQWLARPLALHGVVAKKDGSLVTVTIGEDPADPVFTIPDLLPHLAYRQVEKSCPKPLRPKSSTSSSATLRPTSRPKHPTPPPRPSRPKTATT